MRIEHLGESVDITTLIGCGQEKSNVTREMFFGEESNFAKVFNVAE